MNFSQGELGIYLVMAGIVAGYFLPAIIAGLRSHQSFLAILALNAILGWTAVGWIIAFIWSLTGVKRYSTEGYRSGRSR